MKRVVAAPLLAGLMTIAFAGDVADIEARFMAARDAFRAGERVKLARIADSLRGSEFAPWVTHWQLRLRLEENSSDGVPEFLERENGSYLAEKLRGEWLRQLGKQRQWETFQKEFPFLVQPDQEVSCYGLQARLDRQQDNTALDEARPLWFTVTDLPDACLPLMERLLADGRLTTDDVWTRLRRLMEAKKLGAAKAAARHLPATQAFDTRKLDAVIDNPARYLVRLPKDFAGSRSGRELALFAVQRMARNDPAATATQWRGIESRFDEADRAYAWGQIAWQAALQHLPEALDWYALAAAAPLNDEQLAWQARAALRAQDWPRVAKAIGRMPPKLASLPDWTYWRGRAEVADGRREEATVLYQKISGQPNFYGNLADDELGRPISMPPKAAPPTAEELAEAEANFGLRRALAVLNTDLRIEGVREWAWSLRGMDDRQLLAAAELARRQGVWDRAINTADRTVVEHDYSLRYLAPFRDQVAIKARELALDDGWVFGLMRQESRFVMDARSSVGAKGLMQLMPGTARWVATKIGLADYHPSRMTEMDTNVTLGTRYLKMVLDALDNQPVLASAAYNAGPSRAKKWRGERTLEGAVYAETIPFNETRDYVKKVMSNTVYYAALFEGKPQSLKTRLGVVRARGIGDTDSSELP
ncbi:MAG TPA: transglycosylase SLT domain-containing protein [Rhodocyclaceae bacterium]|nr:transglycosylase SLT domain-containing protein [Rhodocyclaceae bacterium]